MLINKDYIHEVAFGIKSGFLPEVVDGGIARVWNDRGEFIVSTLTGNRISVCGNNVKQLEQFTENQQKSII